MMMVGGIQNNTVFPIDIVNINLMATRYKGESIIYEFWLPEAVYIWYNNTSKYIAEYCLRVGKMAENILFLYDGIEF